MSVMPQTFSFVYGGNDMLSEFGIYVKAIDVLQPALIPRKQTIPGRSGAYDYGARYYNERTVRFDCVSVSDLTRAQARELAFVLSRKDKIVHWKEPDKYYIGQLYDPAELECIGMSGQRFTLTFVCDPFAYGSVVDEAFTNGLYTPRYAGTAETPARIQITNTGGLAVNGVEITITRRN